MIESAKFEICGFDKGEHDFRVETEEVPTDVVRIFRICKKCGVMNEIWHVRYIGGGNDWYSADGVLLDRQRYIV